MRRKIMITIFAAAAFVGAPVVLASPPAEATTCQSELPVVCDVYTAGARALCNATSKFADCIQ